MSGRVLQMIDSMVIQLQSIIGRLHASGKLLPDDVQKTISRAVNLMRDVTAAEQVPSSPLHLLLGEGNR